MFTSHSFIKDELKAFEEYLENKFPAGNSFLYNVSNEMMVSSGKRLRPALVIICGMMNNYSRDKAFPVAAAIETLHTATLVHDDIIDSAKIRRGKPTVAEKHGINLAVYTGDYLLAKAILLISEAGLPIDRLEYVAKAAKGICTGDVNQYLNRNKITSVSSYLRRVMKKTGILFSASCILGAFVSGCSEQEIKLLGRLGMNLGVAFQIRDDLIDIEAETEKAGKPIAKDISEGIATLPFLFAASRSRAFKEHLESFFGESVGEHREIIAKAIGLGGNEFSAQLKNRYIDKCRKLLDIFPRNQSFYAMEEVLNWL